MCVYMHTHGTSAVIVIIIENGHDDLSSNPYDETNGILHSAKTLGKGMHPTIFAPAVGK